MNKNNHSKVPVYTITLNDRYNTFPIGENMLYEKELKFVYTIEGDIKVEKIVPVEVFSKHLLPPIYQKNDNGELNGGYFYRIPFGVIATYKPEIDEECKFKHQYEEFKDVKLEEFKDIKLSVNVPAGSPGPWLCVDKDGTELIFASKPIRDVNRNSFWTMSTTKAPVQDVVTLPKGSIKKLIGRQLTWKDEPYKI